jgi:hypothetical protein
MRRPAILVVIPAWLLLVSAPPSYAQLPNIGLNLGTPGARAMSMGRAFIGIADDASAMITNPAGLITLTRPQVYVEFKRTKFEGLFFDDTQHVGSVPFVGISAPVGTRLAVGFVRHEFMRYSDSFESLDGATYAGTIAASVTPQLRVGATVGVSRMANESEFYESVSGTAVGVSLGALWRHDDRLSFGAAGAIASKYEEVYGIRIPARFGGGVGFRPTPRLLTSFDLSWTSSEVFDAGEAVDLDDTIEARFGGEYLLIPGDRRLFIRAGAHVSSGGETLKEVFGLLPAPGRGGTFGAGVAIGPRFQADFGYATVGELVISAAFRF